MGQSLWKELNLKTIIISRGRYDTITSHKLFPYATLVVPENEFEKYKKYNMDCKAIPDNFNGVGAVKNWVLDNFEEEILIILDDDIEKLWVNIGVYGKEIKDIEIIKQILENTAICCKDLGAKLFGFSTTWDVRWYKENEPFKFVGLIGSVIGIIGRDIYFDGTKKCKIDADYTLKNLLMNRIVWMDTRYSFVIKRNNNLGGNAIFRTTEQRKKEIKELKKRWGEYIKFKTTKTGEITRINVRRRQREGFY